MRNNDNNTFYIKTEQLNHLNELKYPAGYDELTGIYNKKNFFQKTTELLTRNPDKKFLFIRFDIDRFQMVNAFFGKDKGDELLIYIAEGIKKSMSKNSCCTYGRIEADIFCICIAYCEEVNIEESLEKTKNSLENFNKNYNIAPNIGIYVVEDTTTPVELIYERAAMAAKQCKGNYIDFYMFYDAHMGEKLALEQQIINEMNIALSEKQFQVYFQPKYNLKTKKPEGAEALVRWMHPERGMIYPGEFIPIFEKNGFITKLDFYVWEEVCKKMRDWIDNGISLNPISVNVSRVNLYNPKIAKDIIELVKKYNIDPSLLNLELTESAYVDNPKAMTDTITELQNSGFVILMDDFGSGYSSLSILKDVAVDILKIDMRFFSKAKIEGRSENIIASVVRMAKWINVPVIAEGVETREQVEFLSSIGCEYVQGFYYAKPMPAEKYQKLIEKESLRREEWKREDKADFDIDALWATTPQMEMLFTNSIQPIAVFEYSNNVVELLRVNHAYYELVGYDQAFLDTYSIIDAVEEEHREVFIEAFQQAMETEDSIQCEYIRICNDTRKWIQLKLKYISKIGQRDLFFGILEDITSQKKLDQELQRYRTALSIEKAKRKKMLIVDDVEINRVILKEIFKEDYDILEAENGADALDIIKKERAAIDIILLDIVMPVMDGKTFLKNKNKETLPQVENIPVVIITADDRPEAQIDLLALGAKDYIVKPFVPETVKLRVNNVLDSNRNLKDILNKGDDVIEKMQKNMLTDMYSSQEIKQAVRKILSDSKKINAMVLLDIDDFKAVKKYGKNYDQIVINKTIEILKRHFRKQDILAKIDEDKFGVLVTDIPSAGIIVEKCKEICKQISAFDFHEDHKKRISCSIGIAVSQINSHSFEDLYINADKALYSAKCQGKNRVALYENEV